MAKGVFQTDREIFENPIWTDVIKFRIFFYIYGNAVFSKNGTDVAGIHLSKGQYLRSYRNLQTDLEYIEKRHREVYSINTIRRKVESLVKEKRIGIETTDYGTLFTVLNYDKYQGFERFAKRATDTASDTASDTPSEQQVNNNKNVNNVKNDNKKNSAKKTRTYSSDSQEFILASYLLEKMKLNNPDVKEPNLQSWADDVRLMIERDKREPSKIRKMIDWSQSDNFWSGNVLSVKKLRKHFDQMATQANKQHMANKRNGSAKVNREHLNLDNVEDF